MRAENEQLTLEPESPKRPLPLPFLLCVGCANREPSTDPPCSLCGADAVAGEGIPF
jgi:hypothetical protein